MSVYGRPGIRRLYQRGLAHVLLLGLVGLLVTGCFGFTSSTPEDSPTDAPTSEIQVQLLPPDQQEGGTLAVRITDAEGAPVSDATVRLEGDMNHAGMIPVISDPAEHTGEGVYRTPFEFTMLGEWIISVFVTLADGTEVSQQIEIGVDSEGIDIP